MSGCKECKYFDDENSFCTHPSIWVDLLKWIIPIGCTKYDEVEK